MDPKLATLVATGIGVFLIAGVNLLFIRFLDWFEQRRSKN